MTISTESVLIIINLILTAISPILQSLGFFIKHISKSECCGSSITLRNSEIKRKKSVDIEKNKV